MAKYGKTSAFTGSSLAGTRWLHDATHHERIHVASRQSPALLERPPWSDASGQPVALSDPPDDTGHTHTSKGWTVHISPATDADGWQYASVFKCAGRPCRFGPHYTMRTPSSGTLTTRDLVAARRNAATILCGAASGSERAGTQWPLRLARPPSVRSPPRTHHRHLYRNLQGCL